MSGNRGQSAADGREEGRTGGAAGAAITALPVRDWVVSNICVRGGWAGSNHQVRGADSEVGMAQRSLSRVHNNTRCFLSWVGIDENEDHSRVQSPSALIIFAKHREVSCLWTDSVQKRANIDAYRLAISEDRCHFVCRSLSRLQCTYLFLARRRLRGESGHVQTLNAQKRGRGFRGSERGRWRIVE